MIVKNENCPVWRTHLLCLGGPEVVNNAGEEVEERGGDGGVRPHRVVHHQDGRLDVHDVVLHTVFRICIGLNPDPDPAFHVNTDPDPYPAF